MEASKMFDRVNFCFQNTFERMKYEFHFLYCKMNKSVNLESFHPTLTLFHKEKGQQKHYSSEQTVGFSVTLLFVFFWLLVAHVFFRIMVCTAEIRSVSLAL